MDSRLAMKFPSVLDVFSTQATSALPAHNCFTCKLAWKTFRAMTTTSASTTSTTTPTSFTEKRCRERTRKIPLGCCHKDFFLFPSRSTVIWVHCYLHKQQNHSSKTRGEWQGEENSCLPVGYCKSGTSRELAVQSLAEEYAVYKIKYGLVVFMVWIAIYSYRQQTPLGFSISANPSVEN